MNRWRKPQVGKTVFPGRRSSKYIQANNRGDIRRTDKRACYINALEYFTLDLVFAISGAGFILSLMVVDVRKGTHLDAQEMLQTLCLREVVGRDVVRHEACDGDHVLFRHVVQEKCAYRLRRRVYISSRELLIEHCKTKISMNFQIE